MRKNYFFGWTNIKKFITELLKTFSDKSSFFSRKRIEEFFAFVIGQWGMIYFLIVNISKISAGDFAIWAVIQFTLAGFILFQIQKEKTQTNTTNISAIDSNDNKTDIITTKTNSTGDPGTTDPTIN